jgi:hypothetical protein
MRRFRIRRRRAARRALALALPLAALIATATALGAGSSAGAKGPKATLVSGVHNVKFGHHFHLRGSVPGRAHRRLAIAFHAKHGHGWETLRRLVTGQAGNYHVTLRATKSGAYRALSPASRSSVPAQVRVTSRLSAHVVNGGATTAGHTVAVKGNVVPGDAGRPVKVRVGRSTVRTHTDGRGHFKVRWQAGSLGRFPVSVKAKGDRAASGSSDHAGHVTVFRHAVASWYGPGLYGGHLACGGTLEPGTMGVANKTLPCGSKVTLRYRGRQVRVPVIDRGPYVAGRDYDLTAATKSRLGFGSTGTLLSSK